MFFAISTGDRGLGGADSSPGICSGIAEQFPARAIVPAVEA